MKSSEYQFGIREKLILIFILIKVIPLIILAVFASKQVQGLGDKVKKEYSGMVEETQNLVTQIGDLATENSIDALDKKSRESIERLTTDTARAVARFLYQRDDDIAFLARAVPGETLYKHFIISKTKKIVTHGEWTLNGRQDGWVASGQEDDAKTQKVSPRAADNEKEFHYREPEIRGIVKEKPLYLEATFFDLNGVEKIKVTASDTLPNELKDISKRENTWCRAESYFSAIKDLGDNDIYVSEVIGEYIPSPIIGPYTPQSARRTGVAYEPEKSGYAGKENPVGRRFQGIIRWVKPVVTEGKRVGYVSLALDHTHVMEFTDHIVPTSERYSPISDASTGNYAFMWDYKGRNISHPRDYFIVGYNSETGEPAVPWLSDELFRMWQNSNMPYKEFAEKAPLFKDQSLAQKPSAELKKKGNVGLDCRFLNFAPQCTGWHNLTQYGGSGSFVIFWSKLWKLTTAATIPYYTGLYGGGPRGFGYITIGANVHEFHSAANETARHITALKTEYERNLHRKERSTLSEMADLLNRTHKNLTVSTLVMVLMVMLIAVWMASTLTRKILEMIRGITLFKDGDLKHRLAVKSEDEMGQLAQALNDMSDNLEETIIQMEQARQRAEESDKAKGVFLANMSHEIRTPLNAIIGMSRLALKDEEDEKKRYLIKTVRDSADSLLSLINDILDFSKVEAGQLAIENHLFDLPDFLLSTLRSAGILAAEKGLDYSYSLGEDIPNFARGDGMRLKQVLLNILSNAVKFTEKGSIKTDVDIIDVTAKEMRLKVTVEDTGIGIPPSLQEEIFNGFSQVDNTISRQYQGAGLGLAITRRLCQLMGGDVNIDCREGAGCTFVFTVVLEKVEGVDLLPVGRESDGKSEVRKRNILVVEDNMANRDLARMILQGEGHMVVEAKNGVEALEKLTESRVDVIFMDIQMPSMDGLVATRIIRAMEKGASHGELLEDGLSEKLRKSLEGRHHSIIALTAHAMSGDREKCMAAGVDRYLTKPFMPDQILTVLNEV